MGESTDVSALPNAEDPSKPFNLVMPPARPKRSAARQTPTSSPMTLTASNDTFKSPKTPSMGTVSTLSQSDTPATSQPGTPSVAVETTTAPTAPPALPVRSAAALGVASSQSPRLPNRPILPRLGTTSSITAQPGTPGGTSSLAPTPTSRRPSMEGGVGVVNTKNENWQMQCWYEIIRLREVTFWTRVGSTYNQQ